jgi:uncharacterized protein YidB (DUF937 family)
MGLLDGVLGNILGGMLGGNATGVQSQNPLVVAALQVLQQNGGIQGVLAKLQQAGYGEQAQSWISAGKNLPINADAVRQALGSGQLGQIAQQLGLSHGDAADGIASTLPQIIDQMTPHGTIPDNHTDLVSQALALLTKSRTG